MHKRWDMNYDKYVCYLWMVYCLVNVWTTVKTVATSGEWSCIVGGDGWSVSARTFNTTQISWAAGRTFRSGVVGKRTRINAHIRLYTITMHGLNKTHASASNHVARVNNNFALIVSLRIRSFIKSLLGMTTASGPTWLLGYPWPSWLRMYIRLTCKTMIRFGLIQFSRA